MQQLRNKYSLTCPPLSIARYSFIQLIRLIIGFWLGFYDRMPFLTSTTKASKDFSHIKQIKNEHGVVLRDLDIIIGRWKGYFDKLLNEENGDGLAPLARVRC